MFHENFDGPVVEWDALPQDWKDKMKDAPSALDKQTGGNHYKNFAIQPIEAIHKNGLDWFQGNITKYAWRHHFKNGAEDLKKVIHYSELALEMQYGIKPEQNQLEKAVDSVATTLELRATEIADFVVEHQVGGLIFKRILNRLISERQQEVENAINEVVTNHGKVDPSLTVLLDIKNKE
jgi:hypothetical protein